MTKPKSLKIPKKAKKSESTKFDYALILVENSTQKIVLFKTEKAVNSYMETFMELVNDPMEGYWLDMLIDRKSGTIKFLDQNSEHYCI